MSDPIDIQRVRLRAKVGVAAKVLAPTWPIDRFAAVNPLLAFENEPVEIAHERAAKVLGGSLRLCDTYYRDQYSAGGIGDQHLLGAILDLYPAVAHAPGITAGPVTLLPSEVVRLDLLAGEPTPPPPSPEPLLRTEFLDRAMVGTSPTTWSVDMDALASRWAAAYLERSAGWPMPRRDLGLYAAWRRLAPVDPALRRFGGERALAIAADLPESAEVAIAEALVALWVDPADQTAYLQRHLVRQPGWAAAMATSKRPIDDLAGYLAIRLTLESVVLDDGARRNAARAAQSEWLDPDPDTSPIERAANVLTHLAERGVDVSGTMLDGVTAVLECIAPHERSAIWQDALERRYADDLLGALGGGATGIEDSDVSPSWQAKSAASVPEAQVVCCIDTRSEILRRHLEAEGPYETFGFAGFFGLPAAIRGVDDPAATPSCPVVVEPKLTIEERARPEVATRHEAGEATRSSLDDAAHDTKFGGASPFAFAEAAGWLSGPVAWIRTFSPQLADRLARWSNAAFSHRVPTELTVDRVISSKGDLLGLLDDEKAATAHAILTVMGLTKGFAPVVLLCGHGSHHVNNPFRAALNCGACGGRAGGNNARLAAALLNDPVVRSELRHLGIDVPDGTLFVAGEHETTADQVDMFDLDTIAASHQPALARLSAALERAGHRVREERSRSLPSSVGRMSTRPSRVARRRSDWAQVTPEWGLVNNAAMVVGPRSLTAATSLDGRVFLHSYDQSADPTGAVLEAILTGPVVVAHWINSQYRASTVDPDRFGAGTKPLHNAIGSLGVIEGAGGDLRLGLPLESVSVAGRSMHEPLRLLVVVDAPHERVEMLIARNAVLQRLAGNGWIRVMARSDGVSGWARRRRDGEWVPWRAPGVDRSRTGSAEIAMNLEVSA